VMRHDPLAGLEDELDAPAQASLFDGMLTSAVTPAPPAVEPPPEEPKRPSRAAGRRAAPRAERRAPVRERAERTFDAVTLRKHAAVLHEARGPRPAKQIEQLFTADYAPLCEALACGFDDRECERAVAGWRAGFEKSYGEGFTAMRMSGKRPKMVLDAPEEAIRIGRAHGARAVQLVLVDGMRYDLGRRVHGRLAAALAGQATCVDEALLWAALPSTTPVQMQLLASGARALPDFVPPSDDTAVYRDATATIPRRERIGQRDLLKLDVVEARLRDTGVAFDARMDDLADEVCTVLAGIAAELPARTLMYVFGDHGFCLRTLGGERTGRAEQGGSRPEEVLVGATAWLIGNAPEGATRGTKQ
jgi:hypothetical protein